MGFLIRALCPILFLQGTLQCYQARLEFSDRGFGEVDNTYRELNDDVDVLNADLLRSNSDNDNQGINRGELDTEATNTGYNKKIKSEMYDDDEKKRAGQLRRAKAEKRRRENRERTRARHANRLHRQGKGSDIIENPPETEQSKHYSELAHFYLSKPSEISNMSALLGPGPIPIPLTDPTTKRRTTPSPRTTDSSFISENSTGLSLANVKVPANISLEGDDLVFLFRDRNRGHNNNLKSSNNEKKTNDEIFLTNKPKKESRRLHRQHTGFKASRDERENENPKTKHKKIKHKKMKIAGTNTRKNVDKHHVTEQEQITNLSAINHSFRNAANKKFYLEDKDNNPFVGGSQVGREKTTVVVDRVSDDDANKLCLLSDERERYEEEHTSLRDNPAELEKNDGNIKTKSKSQKAIWSKIEHGEWLDQVTLLPLPDFSVRKNITRNKLASSAGVQKKVPKGSSINDEKTPTNDKKHKRKKYVKLKNVLPLNKISKRLKSGFKPDDVEYESDILPESFDEKENKRDERDTKNRAEKNDFKIPRRKNILNYEMENNYENDDEVYDMDTKQDERSYSNSQNSNENANNENGMLEKVGEDYAYDSHLSGNKKHSTDVCIENKTVLMTQTTWSSTPAVVQSMKPTKKPSKQKSTFKANTKSDNKGDIIVGNGQVNGTIDPYEMFLSGQLADDFVDEVLKKVKRSRKISRELGYSNETEETCDRCIELKSINIPERAVMRSSLGKCLDAYNPVKNNSMCCPVPKPMERYLNALVYFEKENENSFYNKIQDDSTFIFTGDYPEAASKGENDMKMNDKYEDGRSSFNKDALDKQLLREDMNEEKHEGKSVGSESFEGSNEKLSNRLQASGEDTVSKSEDLRRNKETEGEVKRNLEKYGKNIKNQHRERKFPHFQENMKENNFDSMFNYRDSAPSKEEYYTSNNEATYPHRTHTYGKVRKEPYIKRKGANQNTHDVHRNAEKTPTRNADRYYVQGSYDHHNQYNPNPKHSPLNSHSSYTLNQGDSLLKGQLAQDNLNPNDIYEIKNPNNMLNNANDFKDNYFGYPPRKYAEDSNLNQYRNDKGFQQKYNFLYEDNGEYSLYPSLENRNLDEDMGRILGNYKDNEGNNARMVKRDAEPLPGYEEEPNVVFEIPVVEYDLYK